MVNYVNEGAFFAWYEEQTGRRPANAGALLQEVFDAYRKTEEPYYTLPPSATVSGAEERYPFRFEDLGCCGASTYFIYFGAPGA